MRCIQTLSVQHQALKSTLVHLLQAYQGRLTDDATPFHLLNLECTSMLHIDGVSLKAELHMLMSRIAWCIDTFTCSGGHRSSFTDKHYCLGLILCAVPMQYHKSTWNGFSFAAFAGWPTFLKLALPCNCPSICLSVYHNLIMSANAHQQAVRQDSEMQPGYHLAMTCCSSS